MHVRKTVSLTSLLSFMLLGVSGIVLYVTPQGRVADWAGWSLAGLGKDAWGDIHIAAAVLFLVAGIWHTVLNWKPIVSYLKDRSQRLRVVTPHFLAALVMTGGVVVLAGLDVPPVSWLLTLNDSLKESAARTWGEPPYGHAELSSLKTLAGQTGLDAVQALELLRQAGMLVDGDAQTLAAIARANGVTPKRVWEVVKEARSQGKTSQVAGAAPSGLGRRVVGELCEELGIPVGQGVAVLKAAGFELAAADATLRALAEPTGRRPLEAFELLRVVAGKSPLLAGHGPGPDAPAGAR
ncbi:MAG: DUF4405 domain-containing protein [Thermoanaerobaculaceae bacterium]|nr:DUF4405 domain-containing protein [Thermoanaerobaculaceae bacterium]